VRERLVRVASVSRVMRQALRRWWVVVVTITGVVVAGAGQALAFQLVPGGWQNFWRVVAVVGAILAAGAPAVDRRRRDEREETLDEAIIRVREEQIVAVNDAIDPLIDKLGSLATSTPEYRIAGARALVTQALASATRVVGSGRRRACFFQLESHDGKRKLIPYEHTGRHGKPKTVFVEGTENGDFVFNLLESDEPYFCPDIKTDPPRGSDNTRTRGYRTFISVPAGAGGESFGMVTIDAPSPGDLNERDIPLMMVFGSVIAVGVILANSTLEADMNREYTGAHSQDVDADALTHDGRDD
jgi:hypothetical protein